MEWKKTAVIKDELAEKGWRDDTLSPLSEKPFWDLCSKLIGKDESIQSILFAKSMPTSLIQKNFVFILTDKEMIYRSDYGGYQSKIKKVKLNEVKIDLFEDKYLPSFIYIDFIFSKFKTLHLQTFDPTGLMHFHHAFETNKA